MRIRVGCEMTYELGQVTPMIAILNVHSSRVSDLERPDYLITTPSVPVEGYRDSFGNWCNRLVAPAGRSPSKPKPWSATRAGGTRDPGAEQVPNPELPAETLLYLLGSRYCETDRLSDVAWSLFGSAPLGWPACRRSATTCTIISPSATSTRARHVRLMRRLRRSKACAATMLIWRSRSADASTFPRAIVLATSATSACRRRMRRRTLPPGSRSFWVGAGTFDPRNNDPRIGRILIARGRDAADVPLTLTFGPGTLVDFRVTTEEVMGSDSERLMFAQCVRRLGRFSRAIRPVLLDQAGKGRFGLLPSRYDLKRTGLNGTVLVSCGSRT